MKNLSYIFTAFIFIVLLAGSITVNAQGHDDPPFLQIQSSESQLTIDGELIEDDWMRRFDHLNYRAGAGASDVVYTVTEQFTVDGEYTDTTTTFIYILHHGLDLYFGIQSDDHYVNKWGGSWEGDGLFMKIADAQGSQVEYKLYFNAAGPDPDIVFEPPSLYPTSGEAAAWKHPATVVNDTTQIDSGYTAEMVIHLDQLGYTDQFSEVPVLMNIFDPDGQTGTPGEEWNIGSYHKAWWGSEWGPDTRILRLADPPIKMAYMTTTDITLDGMLDEGFWNGAESVVIGKGSSLSTGGWYMQWGNPLNSYDDQSMATVKFIHNGTDLYIGAESDDKSVCKWSPGWEADGLFIWPTFKDVIPGPAERLEVKNMYFDDSQAGNSAVFEVNANVPTGAAEGASYEPAGTVTHTEIGGDDDGYSMEVVIHTDLLGYSVGDTFTISIVAWDMDRADAGSFDPDVSDYAPNWWGTQWVDINFERYYLYRGVVLSDVPVDVEDEAISPESFSLGQNYPNPFNPATTISYTIPQSSNVTLKIFDVLGNEISTLVNKEQNAGSYKVNWDASNVSSGIYFYELRSDDFIQARKMMLLK